MSEPDCTERATELARRHASGRRHLAVLEGGFDAERRRGLERDTGSSGSRVVVDVAKLVHQADERAANVASGVTTRVPRRAELSQAVARRSAKTTAREGVSLAADQKPYGSSQFETPSANRAGSGGAMRAGNLTWI